MFLAQKAYPNKNGQGCPYPLAIVCIAFNERGQLKWIMALIFSQKYFGNPFMLFSFPVI